MKSRKNTIKRGGGGYILAEGAGKGTRVSYARQGQANSDKLNVGVTIGVPETQIEMTGNLSPVILELESTEKKKTILGGSKRKSRKSRKAKKTKKGRGVHEGGKKKCPKHCRRKTCRSRKRLKYRKN